MMMSVNSLLSYSRGLVRECGGRGPAAVTAGVRSEPGRRYTRLSGLKPPDAEHPTSQAAGRLAGADGCVRGPGAPRHPSTNGLLVAPPHPPHPTKQASRGPRGHRPPGTPAFGPAACSTSDRYSPLALDRAGDGVDDVPLREHEDQDDRR